MPDWNKGSKKRLKRIRLQGNWPSVSAVTAVVVGLLLIWWLVAWSREAQAIIE